MSLDATRWAWQQELRPSQKLVLLSLADRAGSDNTVWPSYEQICFDTGLDRKTVWGAIKAMVELGLMVDTGERKGVTKQIPVLRLVGVQMREKEQSEKRNDSENGTVPKRARKSSENGTCNSSENGIRNLPVESTKEPKPYAPPIDGTLLTAWNQVRKAKRAGPITEIVWKGIERESALAGISPSDAVRICVERGWQSFKAEWVVGSRQPAKQDKRAEFNDFIYGRTGNGRAERDITDEVNLAALPAV